MKISIYLIVLVVISSYQLSYSQNKQKLDSLLKVYKSQTNDTLKVKIINEIAHTYWYIDANKSIQFAKEGLDLSERINYEYGQGLINQTYGTAHAILGTQDSARIYWGKAMKIFKTIKEYSQVANLNRNLAILGYETGNYRIALKHIDESISIYSKKVNDSLGMGNAYDTQSKIHIYQGNFRMALNSSLKSLHILEKINIPFRLANAYNNLGIIEFYNSNYQKSIEYNEQALAIYRKDENKWWSAQALNDIGNSYYYLKDYNNALTILKECVALAREVDNKSVLGTSLNNLGKTLVALKKYENSIPELKKSLKIAQDMGAKNKIVERLNDLGNAYFGKGDINKSLKFYNKAIALADSIGAKDNLKNGYYFRSRAYAALNDYEKAYSDGKLLIVLKDTIYNETKSQQIQELLTIYETNKKEQQITLQENEIDLLGEKAKVNSLQRALLGSGLLLSLGIIGFGFYGFRQKMKRNKLEKEKLDVELAFKKKELTTHALHLAKKNEVLEGLKQKAEELKTSDNSQNGYQQLIRIINFDLQDDNNWQNFSKYFQQVHKGFNSNVKQKFPEVTSNELRLMSLLKMNLSSKEIANILNISQEGIKKARYRLRKKLNITTEDSLQDLVLSL